LPDPLKVLVVGGSGQLGMALGAAFGRGPASARNQVVSTAHAHPQPGQTTLDLGDIDATTALVRAERPDVVLIAAAMCHVDRCEQEPALCRRINVAAPAAIAEWARGSGARVVFFSTDHVFDGERASYAEDDDVHPLSVYASSKMEAERAIRSIVPAQHLIVRTSWVYGPDLQRRNFILRFIGRLRQGEPVEVPSDQSGSPTFTEDLARAVRFLVDNDITGTFHATGPELIDRVSLARRVCDRFDLDEDLIRPRPTSELGQIARRSLRVDLDCTRLHRTGAPAIRGIDAGLDALAAWALQQEGHAG
jgi:dTDP-4-dehydrorhamnose reductase